ncbi:exodeoxyribonuclease VII large subunit [Salinimicrobium oceani]|uniref:Exodeoxyribonuclease 7 large subunit n=1 Tax=Salinimicrobium oceani TaxID=2722702 RepID=A0ABX1CX47_9FLAO|nr:exodeoxyribonuclease VII large subunit [Salinimicrobium oceani]NJW51373.1 exodeoxyribonuclease VII large subunit [Salinimicrobium oceani]
MAKRVFSLSKLTEAIENVINAHCSKVVWVKAEIVKLNHYPHTGHCYPDLVEKKDGRIIAELKGNIWKANFDHINEKFRQILNEDLRDDMTVVVKATVTYHSVYGLALNILDIDPEYTLGELARQRAEAIKKLMAEGLFEANKKLLLPVLPKTLAIISVDSSKGYQDFINVIEHNQWGYKIHYKLFPAILQGERAVITIRSQLSRIRKHQSKFDAVAIIRGGGGDIGLSCYDNYILAKEIAGFPIPVLTGIGHSTNETVSELVSYRSFITPTKIAEFLLQEFNDFAMPLREHVRRLKNASTLLLERRTSQVDQVTSSFGFLAGRTLVHHKNILKSYNTSLIGSSKGKFKEEGAELKSLAGAVALLSPKSILKRGFSITRKDGKVITSTASLKPGDQIETELFSGKTFATITKNEG